jgi:thiol:disulfide interchange protein DsbD
LLALLPGKIQSLPSSGEWMDTLKVSLGFVELAAALKFFSNVDLVWQWQFLSRELFLLLWAGIFVLAGAYLFGWIKMKGHAASEIGPGRMLGAIAFLLLGAYCWHGYRGHRMDSIMTAIIPNYSSALDAEQGHENVIVDDFEAAKASARAQGKPVLINFTGFT